MNEVQGTSSSVTILLMVALPEEFDIVKEQFPYVRDHSTDRYVRLEFEISTPGYRLIGVLAENMGAISALEAMDEAIKDLSPNLVVCIGISGGLSDDVRLGDVCVSNVVLDVLHNAKLSGKGNRTEVHFSPRHYDVPAPLSASASFARNHPSLAERMQNWQSAAKLRAEELGISSLTGSEDRQLYVGPVVCGPVVSSDAVRRELKRVDRKALALDTESGGVFNRLHQAGIAGLSIRGICDAADSSKANLEKESKGSVRRFAMENAIAVLKIQLTNPLFMSVAKRAYDERQSIIPGLLPATKTFDPIALVESEIVERLEGCDMRGRPPTFKLPLPRVRAVSYLDDVAGRELDAPVDLIDALSQTDRMLIRLPRTFPGQSIGWSLAHSLIRQEIDGRAVLPIVIDGKEIKRPHKGLASFLPKGGEIDTQVYCPVYIIEEPSFASRSKINFLINELEDCPHRVVTLTKIEDNISILDEFMLNGSFEEYELSPISFSETAAYLERTFDMLPGEAEAVAIRLDETFRKFKLDVHPTYFAGLQEDTIAAVINANKRAELIQLAVVGLLSLIVAADRGVPRLTRTTREKFLRQLSLELNVRSDICTDRRLSEIAELFLAENKFSISTTQFLSPFFDAGLLYKTSNSIHFSHPYLESYLLSEALREDVQLAAEYFDPARAKFDYYAFDLYCERGPNLAIIDKVRTFAIDALEKAKRATNAPHVFCEKRADLRRLSNPQTLGTWSKKMVEAGQKMSASENNESVRKEKQRILDARHRAKTEVGARRIVVDKGVSAEIRAEHKLLDGLSRSFTLSCVAVGSGSESIPGATKVELGNLVLRLGEAFSDLWTRNRLRIDFAQSESEILADENIWAFMEEADIGQEEFSKIKSELQMFFQGFATNMVSEPTGRVLWTISSAAGIPVLAPVVSDLKAEDPVTKLLRASWMLDVDAARGKAMLKDAIAEFKGDGLLRIIYASHFLNRVFWHHYKTASAQKFIDAAKRVLAPIGLVPNKKRVEQAKLGPPDKEQG